MADKKKFKTTFVYDGDADIGDIFADIFASKIKEKSQGINLESASIANQRAILLNFCEQNGWSNVMEFQDDGYSGLNMNRPDFQKLVGSIQHKEINVVLKKIRVLAKKAIADDKAMAAKVKDSCSKELSKNVEMLSKKVVADQERINLLDKIIARLYEDMLSQKSFRRELQYSS